eukprot:TRINITY_DN3265_c0_g2_i1.p1 TRINITY_DN3265_c0_g2~~TRINITY_DN3265_c0_g2_i1.p1  ORF type:complete len:891 (+),score=110.64 TRINITY_DN3265_c0_g2_i1:3-2675(+)
MSRGGYWCHLVPLVIIFLIHLGGLYFYTTGFFLTRHSIDEISSCENPPVAVANSSGCWSQKIYKKAVVLIIDALRYDFAIKHDQIEAEGSYWKNHLPIFDSIIKDPTKGSGHLFKFIADPPTTTMQRLKGMTTGGLPTFFDASDNFDTSESIKEDSWIYQLYLNGFRTVFMGDDTWGHLYPSYFKRNYSYPSFNVKDLHTVDNGVIEHLLPEMRGGDWDVIIGHFLGVDHVGHRFGPDHPAMIEKLQQMNHVVSNVIDEIDDETILFVLGDHGMTTDGNHGGASDLETEAALFVYSKKETANNEYTYERVVHQIDIVPTISTLLGLPIPYGNLGKVIPELYINMNLNIFTDPINEIPTEQKVCDSLKYLTDMSYLEASQLNTYLNKYSELSSQIPEDEVKKLTMVLLDANALKEQYDNEKLVCSEMVIKKYHNLYKRYVSYHDSVLELCTRLWSTFDTNFMLLGIFLVALSVIFLFYSLKGISIINIFVKNKTFWLICILRFFSLWSNSYIETEELTMLYLVLTVLCLKILPKITNNGEESGIMFILLIVCIRLSTNVTGGKHESYNFSESALDTFIIMCITTILIYLKKGHGIQTTTWILSSCATLLLNSVFPNNIAIALNVISSIIVVIVLLKLLTNGKVFYNLVASSLSLVLVAIYWISIQVDYIDDKMSSNMDQWILRILIPLFIYSNSVIAMLYSLLYEHKNMGIVISIFPTLMILLGPPSVYSLTLIVVILHLLKYIVIHAETGTFDIAAIMYLLSILFFYFTGHAPRFDALQFSAGFIGFDYYNYTIGGILMILNTFASMIIFVILLPFVDNRKNINGNTGYNNNVLLSFLLLVCVSTMSTMLFTYFARRHLMVWRIFAPKYMFDAAILLVVDIVIILSYSLI